MFSVSNPISKFQHQSLKFNLSFYFNISLFSVQETVLQIRVSIPIVNYSYVHYGKTVQSIKKKLCFIQGNPGEFEKKKINTVLPDQKKKLLFYSVSRYKQWDRSPVPTRNRNPRPGQNWGSQQQLFKHSKKRKNTQKKQGEMYPKKIKNKNPSKEYWLGSISSALFHQLLVASFSAFVTCIFQSMNL